MRLIKNEWIKIWSQRNAWIMLIVVFGSLCLLGGIIKYFETDQSTAELRKKENETSLALYQDLASMEDIDIEQKEYYEEQAIITQYRMDNDLVAEGAPTLLGFMDNSMLAITMLVGIFTVVVAAGIVSSEFGTGTIKMLLTRPIARWKILLSKLTTSILYGMTVLVASVVFAYLLGMILFGADPAVTYELVNGVVTEIAVENTVFDGFLYTAASLLMTILFAFMLGSIFGSSTLAVSLALVLLFMGTTISMFISQYEFAKYIWFVNDFSYYAPGSSPLIPDLTFGFSLVVNIVYAIIFLSITFGYFTKRDITA